MKKIYILTFLFLSSCMTTGNKSSDKISLPVTKENKKDIELIKQASTSKIRIFEKNGVFFDFFYGAKGSYFIILSQKENLIDLSNYDISLSIESDRIKENPEFISLSIEDDRVLSGYGEIREGDTSFNLILDPIDKSLNKKIEIPFKTKIKSIF